MAALLGDFNTKAKASVPLIDEPSVQDAKALFESTPWGDRWDDADVVGLVRYLFGATGLEIPKTWGFLRSYVRNLGDVQWDCPNSLS